MYLCYDTIMEIMSAHSHERYEFIWFTSVSSVVWTVSAHFYAFGLFKLLKHFLKAIYKIIYFFYVTQNYL